MLQSVQEGWVQNFDEQGNETTIEREEGDRGKHPNRHRSVQNFDEQGNETAIEEEQARGIPL